MFKKRSNTVLTQLDNEVLKKYEDEQEFLNLIKDLKHPEGGVNPGPRSFLGLKFDRVFKGSDLVAWLALKKGLSKHGAQKLGEVLLKTKNISHASTDLLPFTLSCFYRFSENATKSQTSSRAFLRKSDTSSLFASIIDSTDRSSVIIPDSSDTSFTEKSDEKLSKRKSNSKLNEKLERSNSKLNEKLEGSNSKLEYQKKNSQEKIQRKSETLYISNQEETSNLGFDSFKSGTFDKSQPRFKSQLSLQRLTAAPSYTTSFQEENFQTFDIKIKDSIDDSESSSQSAIIYETNTFQNIDNNNNFEEEDLILSINQSNDSPEDTTLESVFTSLNLKQYLDLFSTQNLDINTVRKLTTEDLKGLGIPLGDCIRILDATRGTKRKSNQNNNFEDISFKITDISIGRKIGGGNYGEVYEGLLFGTTPIALKQLAPDNSSSNSVFESFRKEATILKSITHPNVLAFLGLWSYGGHWIVTELLPLGDLKNILKKDEKNSLSLKDLCSIALETAAGMNCLSLKGIVHLDLSARNLLVKQENQKLSVRVADFGLAKSLGSDFSFAKGVGLPIKWSAPEIFLKKQINSKCDVWSYGMTLWEIFTYGQDPYPGFTNQGVLDLFGEEKIPMKQNEKIPDFIYNELMIPCWNYTPQERPSFKEIFDKIRNFDTEFLGQSLPNENIKDSIWKSPVESSTQSIQKELEILREIDSINLRAQQRIDTLQNYILEIKKETNEKLETLRKQLNHVRKSNAMYQFSNV